METKLKAELALYPMFFLSIDNNNLSWNKCCRESIKQHEVKLSQCHKFRGVTENLHLQCVTW